MKKYVNLMLFSILLITVNNITFNNVKFCYAEKTFYAQVIENEDVFLYSTPSQDDKSKKFILPQTYFVELFKNENEDFYYARYADVYGYVLKDNVKPVKDTPANPFLQNMNFRVFVPSGANLRSSAENLGTINLICSIPFLNSNLLYYGCTIGEEAISKKGQTWYYCKYYSNNNEYFGYVYAPLCDSLPTLTKNTENVEYIDNITFENNNIIKANTEVFSGLSPTATTLLIIAISLPCLLFLYLLFKPTKIAEQNSASVTKRDRKKKISRLKNSDYYEFDDDF